MKKAVKKGDILLLIVFIFIASLMYFILEYSMKKDGEVVLVWIDGKVYKSYGLDEEIEENISYIGNNILSIKENSVNISAADCKDKICVNHKSISKAGETIICLPNKLIVEVK